MGTAELLQQARIRKYELQQDIKKAIATGNHLMANHLSAQLQRLTKAERRERQWTNYQKFESWAKA